MLGDISDVYRCEGAAEIVGFGVAFSGPFVMRRHLESLSFYLSATECLVEGEGSGVVLASSTPLSLWGGVDPDRGEIIDRHHPLCGEGIAGRALVIPHGRGSCTGSVVLLEAIHAGQAPAVIVLNRVDDIIALGAIVAEEVLSLSVPIVVLDDARFAMAQAAHLVTLHRGRRLVLSGPRLAGLASVTAGGELGHEPAPAIAANDGFALTPADRRCLDGEDGPAAQAAMRIVLRMARLQGALGLLDVTRVHVDGCIYTGPAGLAFAERLAAWGGRVRVPTTLNAISVDRRRWEADGVPDALGVPASRLADAYVALGAQPTYTCAPYLLDGPPQLDEPIAWAESNAVVYANSVLGARTNKTPDLLDICIALTGRAPSSGYYLETNRWARLRVDLPPLPAADESLYPLLGYVIGAYAGDRVPVICGLDISSGEAPSALKAFGAAFATTASAGLFHVAGVTPEAVDSQSALGGVPPEASWAPTLADLRRGWLELNGERGERVDLIALGNPHFSLDEFATLASLCRGRRKHDDVELIVTTSRHVAGQARRAGHLATLEAFGSRIMTDTCWCMLQAPIVAPSARTILTNSAKYAHYAPGLVGRQVRFAGLSTCVTAAVDGRLAAAMPAWLGE